MNRKPTIEKKLSASGDSLGDHREVIGLFRGDSKTVKSQNKVSVVAPSYEQISVKEIVGRMRDKSSVAASARRQTAVGGASALELAAAQRLELAPRQEYSIEVPKSGTIDRDEFLTPMYLPTLCGSSKIDESSKFDESRAKKSHPFNPKFLKIIRNLVYCRDKVLFKKYLEEHQLNGLKTNYGLTFESNFECGNLLRAESVVKKGVTVIGQPEEYDLYLQPDPSIVEPSITYYSSQYSATKSCCQWFFFGVQSTKKRSYRFNIRNMTKDIEAFKKGIQPLMISETEYTTKSIGWRRVGEQISYTLNKPTDTGEEGEAEKKTFTLGLDEKQETYTLSFVVSLDHSQDTVYFALSPPYSYTQLQNMIFMVSRSIEGKKHCTIRPLCRTMGGNRCDALIITENNEKLRDHAKNDINPSTEKAGNAALGPPSAVTADSGVQDIRSTTIGQRRNSILVSATSNRHVEESYEASLESRQLTNSSDKMPSEGRNTIMSDRGTLESESTGLLGSSDDESEEGPGDSNLPFFLMKIQELMETGTKEREKKKEMDLRKPFVIITARVHGGETASSWACEGIIKFLLGDSVTAVNLRQRFVFYIVPMLNPDGVINGFSRHSLVGIDLNRQWEKENSSLPTLHPTVQALKHRIRKISSFSPIVAYFDLHSQLVRDGAFFNGCLCSEGIYDKLDATRSKMSDLTHSNFPYHEMHDANSNVFSSPAGRVLPKLKSQQIPGLEDKHLDPRAVFRAVAKKCHLVNLKHCSVRNSAESEVKGRVVMTREFSIPISMTVEIPAFRGPPTSPSYSKYCTPADYARFGCTLCLGLAEVLGCIAEEPLKPITENRAVRTINARRVSSLSIDEVMKRIPQLLENKSADETASPFETATTRSGIPTRKKSSFIIGSSEMQQGAGQAQPGELRGSFTEGANHFHFCEEEEIVFDEFQHSDLWNPRELADWESSDHDLSINEAVWEMRSDVSDGDDEEKGKVRKSSKKDAQGLERALSEVPMGLNGKSKSEGVQQGWFFSVKQLRLLRTLRRAEELGILEAILHSLNEAPLPLNTTLTGGPMPSSPRSRGGAKPSTPLKGAIQADNDNDLSDNEKFNARKYESKYMRDPVPHQKPLKPSFQKEEEVVQMVLEKRRQQAEALGAISTKAAEVESLIEKIVYEAEGGANTKERTETEVTNGEETGIEESKLELKSEKPEKGEDKTPEISPDLQLARRKQSRKGTISLKFNRARSPNAMPGKAIGEEMGTVSFNVDVKSVGTGQPPDGSLTDSLSMDTNNKTISIKDITIKSDFASWPFAGEGDNSVKDTFVSMEQRVNSPFIHATIPQPQALPPTPKSNEENTRSGTRKGVIGRRDSSYAVVPVREHDFISLSNPPTPAKAESPPGKQDFGSPPLNATTNNSSAISIPSLPLGIGSRSDDKNWLHPIARGYEQTLSVKNSIASSYLESPEGSLEMSDPGSSVFAEAPSPKKPAPHDPPPDIVYPRPGSGFTKVPNAHHRRELQMQLLFEMGLDYDNLFGPEGVYSQNSENRTGRAKTVGTAKHLSVQRVSNHLENEFQKSKRSVSPRNRTASVTGGRYRFLHSPRTEQPTAADKRKEMDNSYGLHNKSFPRRAVYEESVHTPHTGRQGVMGGVLKGKGNIQSPIEDKTWQAYQQNQRQRRIRKYYAKVEAALCRTQLVEEEAAHITAKRIFDIVRRFKIQQQQEENYRRRSNSPSRNNNENPKGKKLSKRAAEEFASAVQQSVLSEQESLFETKPVPQPVTPRDELLLRFAPNSLQKELDERETVQPRLDSLEEFLHWLFSAAPPRLAETLRPNSRARPTRDHRTEFSAEDEAALQDAAQWAWLTQNPHQDPEQSTWEGVSRASPLQIDGASVLEQDSLMHDSAMKALFHPSQVEENDVSVAEISKLGVKGFPGLSNGGSIAHTAEHYKCPPKVSLSVFSERMKQLSNRQEQSRTAEQSQHFTSLEKRTEEKRFHIPGYGAGYEVSILLPSEDKKLKEEELRNLIAAGATPLETPVLLGDLMREREGMTAEDTGSSLVDASTGLKSLDSENSVYVKYGNIYKKSILGGLDVEGGKVQLQSSKGENTQTTTEEIRRGNNPLLARSTFDHFADFKPMVSQIKKKKILSKPKSPRNRKSFEEILAHIKQLRSKSSYSKHGQNMTTGSDSHNKSSKITLHTSIPTTVELELSAVGSPKKGQSDSVVSQSFPVLFSEFEDSTDTRGLVEENFDLDLKETKLVPRTPERPAPSKRLDGRAVVTVKNQEMSPFRSPLSRLRAHKEMQ